MLLVMGDSKTGANAWPGYLRVNANALGRPGLHLLSAYNTGVAFQTLAAGAATQIPVVNAMNPGMPVRFAFINFGVNEFSVWGSTVEATWKADYLSIIDAVNAKWPSAKIYLTKPWARGNLSKANTLAGWIDDIVALRPGIAFVGDDERSWLEGGDDGATNTTDGTHYSTTGQLAAAAAKLTVLAL